MTHPGLRRPRNEDRYAADPEAGLFLVVDGVGGQAAGEVASETVADVIGQFVRQIRGETDATWPFGIDPTLSADANCLRTAVLLANRAIARRVRRDPALAGMAATVSAALLAAGRAAIANVGDCRAYAFRDAELRQLTNDHSWVAEQVRSGALDPDGARVHPMRNVVTRALAGDDHLEVDVIELPLRPGDVLLLCSDGLHGQVTDDAIHTRLQAAGGNLDLACECLIESALQAGGPDNATVLLVAATGG